jgi:probable rRNA maturation factor
MINIEIIDRFKAFIEPHIIQIAAQQTLLHQNITDEVDFSILVEDEDKLKELNHQYLGIDSATDVLSFPANEIDPETGRNYLGDIIISFNHAKEQARNASHSTDSEIQLLVVHGILHLLGYDHANSKEKKKMWAIQDDILTSIPDMNNKII